MGTHGYSGVLRTTQLLDAMRARTRNTDHAPCDTSTHAQPAMRRMALRGTQEYSWVIGCRMACVRAHETQTVHRAAWSRHAQPAMRTRHRADLKGTRGYSVAVDSEHAKSKVARATIAPCMPRGICIREPCDLASASVSHAIIIRENKMENRCRRGTTAHSGLCVWHCSSPQRSPQGERPGPVGHSCAAAHGVANGACR
jgi:hypothetical protein